MIYKLIILSFFIGMSTNVLAQKHNIGLRTGYNRVGVFFNPNYQFEANNHLLEAGIKAYGYNLFFEKQPVGFRLAYGYHFLGQVQFSFYTSLNFNSFQEQRSISKLLLNEIGVVNGLSYNPSQKWSFRQEIGFGFVSTRSKEINTNNIYSSAYFNFEISFGLVYHFLGM